ncbi:hypothetical protein QVA66_03930 [Staphylococcus chromogenes]|nr:hypothetical protein [Staphylococcus chromogenes]
MRDLEPGWWLYKPAETVEDPETGNSRLVKPPPIAIRATLQEVRTARDEEITSSTVIDERVILVKPAMDIPEMSWFTSPDGEIWQTIGEGRKRHRPGFKPRYSAVQVRRAKERET